MIIQSGNKLAPFDFDQILPPADEKIFDSLSAACIYHSSFKNAYDTILNTIRFNKCTHAPEPSSVLLLGESGTGKTTLHEHLLAVLPGKRIELEGIDMVTKIPFFHSSLPNNATPGAMAIQMLNSMGLLDRNQIASTQRIRYALARADTFGIMYDELHNLAGTKTPYMVEQARGWIRDLITDTGVMIIGFGTPDCQEIFLKEPQVQKRFPVTLHLKGFEYSNEGSEFEQVINTFDAAIEQHHAAFAKFESQRTRRFCAAMYVKSGGNMHAIKTMFEKSLFDCLDGDRIYDFNLFAKVAQRAKFYSSLDPNGFLLSYEQCLNIIANQKSKKKR